MAGNTFFRNSKLFLLQNVNTTFDKSNVAFIRCNSESLFEVKIQNAVSKQDQNVVLQ